MSDVTEISGWVDKIQKGIWDSFGMASKEVMDAWAVFIVSRMRTNRMNPSAKPISIWKGKLARGIQGQEGSTDDGIMEENVIVYERTLRVPYGAISEYGGTTSATPKARRAMFATLKKLGTYNPHTSWTNASKFIHPAFNFIKDSIPEMSMDRIEQPIRRHLDIELNKIPNLEVVIGNK